MVATRRNLQLYGISLGNLRYHLDIAATAIVPVAIASIPFSFVDYRKWSGAVIMVAVEVALLFVICWLLKRKPTRNENGLMVAGLFLTNSLSISEKTVLGNAVSALLFYVFFLGLGEELLFRGYIQSRLNAAWGKPFQFCGVNWGWGMILTSILFGFMHVLNIYSLIIGNWHLEWWWGLWTFFAGMVNGYVREKTGSIVASTILHGLPQGLAYAFLNL